MSLCHRGLEVKLTDTRLTVVVSAKEPLLVLANALDWAHIAHLAMPDLRTPRKAAGSRKYGSVVDQDVRAPESLQRLIDHHL